MALARGFVYSFFLSKEGKISGFKMDDEREVEGNLSLEGENTSQKIVAISAGGAHLIALTNLGEVLAWGENTFGQGGDGSRAYLSEFIKVKGIEGKVKEIATGVDFLALTKEGKVYGWGRNLSKEFGYDTQEIRTIPKLLNTKDEKIRNIAAGTGHCLYLTESGKLYGLGSNGDKQAGGEESFHVEFPKPIEDIPGKIISIAAGDAHSLVLTKVYNGKGFENQIWSWGRNNEGQLGDKTRSNSFKPLLLKSTPRKVKKISAGYSSSFAIDSHGRVFGWGWNFEKQLGISGPERIFMATPIEKVFWDYRRLPFGRGGKFGGFIELEKTIRGWLGQEIVL